MRRRAERALSEVGAAMPLGAICLLVANDHEFKRRFHNALTGKLSDVAICFLLPLLVSSTLGLVSDWPGRRRLAVGAVVASLVFTLLEMSDVAGELFGRVTGALGLGGGTLTRDPTDLLALACVPLAIAYGRKRLAAAEHGSSVWRSATGALVIVTGSLSLMATSKSGGQPPPCTRRPPPATFLAEAGCGPGGLIVVESGINLFDIQISNASAVGLPPFPPTASCMFSSGEYSGNPYQGDGGTCSFTSWDQGGWDILISERTDGRPGTCDCYLGCTSSAVGTCSAVLAHGVGTLTCQPSDGGAPCSSRLSEVSDGGTTGAAASIGGPSDAGAVGSSTDGSVTDEEVSAATGERAVDASNDVD